MDWKVQVTNQHYKWIALYAFAIDLTLKAFILKLQGTTHLF